jgi:hypothetical protein
MNLWKGVNMDDLRRIEILREDGWQEAEFTDIEPNDTFRMFDPDGSPVTDSHGETDFFAVSEVYMHPELDVWTVNVSGEYEDE